MTLVGNCATLPNPATI